MVGFGCGAVHRQLLVASDCDALVGPRAAPEATDRPAAKGKRPIPGYLALAQPANAKKEKRCPEAAQQAAGPRAPTHADTRKL